MFNYKCSISNMYEIHNLILALLCILLMLHGDTQYTCFYIINQNIIIHYVVMKYIK